MNFEKNLNTFHVEFMRTEKLLGMIHDSIVITDQNGRIQWINKPYLDLTSSSEDIIGQFLIDHLNLISEGFEVPRALHPITKALQGEKIINDRYILRKNHGNRVIDIRASLFETSKEDKSVAFILRDSTDVLRVLEDRSELLIKLSSNKSDEKRLEEVERVNEAIMNIMEDLNQEKMKLEYEINERRKAEYKIRQLSVSVDQSPNAILITDENGKIEYANNTYERLSGYKQEDAIGKTVHLLDSSLCDEETYKQLWADLREGNVWRGELLNKRIDGTTYWEYAIVSPIYDENKLIKNYLVILQDITDNKKSEQQMKEALAMKSEFTSTVSHELRTPLASMKAAIDIVMSETAGPITDDQRMFLDKAKINIDRLKRLIDDILDISKLESEKFSLNFQSIQLKNLIKEIVDIQQPVANKKGLNIEFINLNRNIPDVLCDVDRINQVLMNLFNNSIKFTENGKIEVSLTYDMKNSFVVCSVKDTGEGISQDDQKFVFDKFKQFGDPSTRKTGGTGLGLAICKEIIHQHQGEIWLESEIDHGTTFYFSLPAKLKND